jgi:hypothetical protein
MTAHAFLVLPSEIDEHVKRCVDAANDVIGSGTTDPLPSARATRVQVFDVAPGRNADTLSGRDAIALYRLLHVGRVVVLAFGEVWVRSDPRRDNVDRQAIPLRRFVQHKATFGRVHNEADVARVAADHTAWCASVACTGDDDPRVLPLHSFSTHEEWPDLESDSAVAAFQKRYGRPRSRTDASGRTWSKPYGGGMHGWGTAEVAGCTLSRGMHWDVHREKRAKFLSPHEVWEFGAGAHLNVGPTSDVRRPGRDSNARRIWPERPEPKPKPLRTRSGRRRGHRN